MPNEMITLQLGQCGNQSKNWCIHFFSVQMNLDLKLCIGHPNQRNRKCYPNKYAKMIEKLTKSRFFRMFSWLRVLEASLSRAWNITNWYTGRICHRWWARSERCVFLSGQWWFCCFCFFDSHFFFWMGKNTIECAFRRLTMTTTFPDRCCWTWSPVSFIALWVHRMPKYVSHSYTIWLWI